MYETGFREALCRITLSHKEELKATLRDHYSIIKTKAEIDQFCAGLQHLGILQCIKAHKDLLAPMFIPQSSTLSKGKCFILPSSSKGYHLFCVACTGHYLVSFLFAEYFKSLLNAVFSSSNPQRKAKEEQTFIYFMDFIEECEGMYVTLISMYAVQYYFLFWKPRWYCSN